MEMKSINWTYIGFEKISEITASELIFGGFFWKSQCVRFGRRGLRTDTSSAALASTTLFVNSLRVAILRSAREIASLACLAQCSAALKNSWKSTGIPLQTAALKTKQIGAGTYLYFRRPLLNCEKAWFDEFFLYRKCVQIIWQPTGYGDPEKYPSLQGRVQGPDGLEFLSCLVFVLTFNYVVNKCQNCLKKIFDRKNSEICKEILSNWIVQL